MSAPPEDVPRPLQEHLIELLERLRRALIALGIGSAAISAVPASLVSPHPSFDFRGYTPFVMAVINRMRDDLLGMTNSFAESLSPVLGIPEVHVQLIAYSWMDSVEVLMYVAVLLGALVTSPYIGYQLYMYLKPALYPHERKAILSFSVGFAALFLFGVVYAYYTILPITFAFLTWLFVGAGAAPTLSIKEFFSFAIMGMVATGLFFTFPLAIALAAKLGLVSAASLRRRWKEVFFVVTVIAAAITPDPTPVSMSLLALPFFALYALATLLAGIMERRSGGGGGKPGERG